MNIESVGFQSVKPLGITQGKNGDGGVLFEKISTQPFDSYFKAYLNLIEDTNTYQVQADSIQMDFASGKTDDMLAVILSQEKAYASLNFTIQVTNKIIDAYKEIMRISL